MSRIKTIEELYQAMRLEGIYDFQDIEKLFPVLADALLNNFVIRRGDKDYRFVEIEFYHNKTDDEGKNITYKRGYAKSCDFFFHDYGVDLCFESNPDSYGGILIRSMECDGEFINGPVRVTDRLFDKFSSLHTPEDFPLLKSIDVQDDNLIVPESSSRWIKSSNKKYRYSWPKTKWAPDSKEYKASPWAGNNP